jgi:hypothetical protein
MKKAEEAWGSLKDFTDVTRMAKARKYNQPVKT